MVGADLLRIIFQVNGTGFVMPVADLLAIRGPGEDKLLLERCPENSLQLGTLAYRENDVIVYDLAALFGLGASREVAERQMLVFASADGPWAVPVDDVFGVVDEERCICRDLPGYLLRDSMGPYQQVAAHEGSLLVYTDAKRVSGCWRLGLS